MSLNENSVNQAWIAIGFLALYDFAIGFPGVLVGLFSGPGILVVAGIHLLFGLALSTSAFLLLWAPSKTRAVAWLLGAHFVVYTVFALAAAVQVHSLVAAACPLLVALLSGAALRAVVFKSTR